ncbi:Inactive leucine-rich repeat receptor-like serine/threonine-protein kinase [Thalictrum thalictroides]|uniref:Inactive leucine-rich repeat receptor-like serine/threonine-protein kinase n=1 Tax=Thalictrum thalictroides TaxID=46969 RepID=A0A7J6VNZ1_THATH|nr:Inactive leucine-rich repeat receptor-like serine/threonine-protein kinase [Thalictrum thalictroides]
MFTLLLFLYLSLPLQSSSLPVIPSDALSLLAFKSKADLSNKLSFTLHKRYDFCHWVGVECVENKVVRLVLQGFDLNGVFESNTLSQLDQLRVLSLQNNSLTGPIPDLSQLINLKSLFLNHNLFSGFFPTSVLSLYRIRILDLSYNNLTGLIPIELTHLDRIYYLQLNSNHFNGTIPPFNQSLLQAFNVSDNNLTGAIPVTNTLLRFNISSFSRNPELCGQILHTVCSLNSSKLPFFAPSEAVAAPPPTKFEQNQQLEGVTLSPPSKKTHKRIALSLGFSFGVLLLFGSILSVFLVLKKRRRKPKVSIPLTTTTFSSESAFASTSNPTEQNDLKMMEMRKSGNLVFCKGEEQVYSLDQLMTGSAEMLGRGSIGTSYKAVLDNHLIVCVKRLDFIKTANTSKEVFQRHIQVVGNLRHPNLVPVKAYFQAKEEKLIIYDYQSNGSLFSLIHGLRSTRAKPLHWTSCLKIAEDVIQGLSYIHQESSLVHGNLKASNVLLGNDLEARLTDYCLAVLFNTSCEEDTDSAGYRAPEVHKSSIQATTKSDVYAFGVLLLELLTSKPPSQHPFLMPADLLNWVRHAREVEDSEDKWLGMLIDIATACNRTLPEQRPTTWQVVMAMKSDGGDEAVLQTLHRAREVYRNKLQANAAADELASLFAECAIAEAHPLKSEPSPFVTGRPSVALTPDVHGTSILAKSGREQIMLDAFSDGSSFICLKCGGLVSNHRKDEHLAYWCCQL